VSSSGDASPRLSSQRLSGVGEGGAVRAVEQPKQAGQREGGQQQTARGQRPRIVKGNEQSITMRYLRQQLSIAGNNGQ